MGTDINAFIEYSNGPSFSGSPDEPAHLFAVLQLNRDYRLFDALGDAVSSQISSDRPATLALYPPRGLPSDVSLNLAREYYLLIVDSDAPDPAFWPHHSCIDLSEAEQRVQASGEHVATVRQLFNTIVPRTWRVIPRQHVLNASWLLRHEINEVLEHANIAPSEIEWDFRTVLTCLEKIEDERGSKRVRLVFWFDK